MYKTTWNFLKASEMRVTEKGNSRGEVFTNPFGMEILRVWWFKMNK